MAPSRSVARAARILHSSTAWRRAPRPCDQQQGRHGVPMDSAATAVARRRGGDCKRSGGTSALALVTDAFVPRGGSARIGRARRLSCHAAERRIVPNARGWCEPRVISAPDERHGITGRYGHGNGAACGRNGAHTRPISRRIGSSLRRSEAQAGTKISKVGDRCGAWTRGRRRRVQAVDLANLGPRPHGSPSESKRASRDAWWCRRHSGRFRFSFCT